MKFNSSMIKIWSRIGSRASFGMAALELGKIYKDLIIISGDTSTSAGLERFKTNFPSKYLDVGIAEQNMMGIAAGLSSEGHHVFTTTFAPFQTMRCCEQIKVNLGYMNHKVIMVGLASGLSLGMLGYTHCSIEDIGVLRSIPGITIISPADSASTIKATLLAINHDQSVYIRLTGPTPNPPVYSDNFEFIIGKSNIISDCGKDIAMIGCGSMVYNALEASELLNNKELKTTVIDMHTIKPIDEEMLEKISKNFKLIVTVEEHNVIGGLGSAVAEYISEINQSPPLLKIGIQDAYGEAGNYQTLLKGKRLMPDQISKLVSDKFQTI
ncbi:MAG: transketolase [bacterium TMED264]|nr:MAG: transketolase [bacterium TMED264]